MPKLIPRAALLLASCSFILATAAIAQEKAAPKTMEWTTSSIAAKTALWNALEEVTNIGGGRRFDAKLKAVITSDPNFALGRAWYAAYTSTLTPAERQTELTRALKDAALNGSTAELLFIAGLRESRAGRNDVARDLLDAVLKLTPDDREVTWARLLIAADGIEALRIGESAIKRFPDYAPIYNIHAYRLNTSGRTEEALQTVARYLALAPKHPNAHDSYAEILQLNGRLDEADAHYVHALGSDPNFDEALVGRAEIAILRGNHAMARAYLNNALSMALTPARRQMLQRDVAATFLMQGNLKEARSIMENVVADAERNTLNALPDKRTLAVIAALLGNSGEAGRQYAAGIPLTAGFNLPLNDASFHALLDHVAEVSKAVVAMEANAAMAPDNADTQQAMFTARVIGAVMNNDLRAAREAHKLVTVAGYKALSGAFLAQAARKAGDKSLAQSAQADVDAFKDLSLNAGLAQLIAKRN